MRTETFLRTPLLAGLSGADREAIGGLARERRFNAGEILFYEGDPCEGLWVLGAGTVKIAKITPSGREIALAIESAPSSVAEVTLFDNGPYPATVTAVRDTVAFLLPRDAFYRYCQEHPDVCLQLLAVAGRRLRQLVTLVESLTFGSVRQRLARTLLDIRNQSGVDEFNLPVTQEELALRLGTVREVVSRNLGRFQAEGMIRVERGTVMVLRPETLESEAEANY
ncbi:MAG: Crp/Fnr family transcriptional regulator [Bryobacteraceae bacterium]|nr:Crp/Fnr family transcriptional regulator [Bryobacteraceae bacterium]